MDIKREIISGTAEKGDVCIRIYPYTGGRRIEIEQIPHPRFISREENIIRRILDAYRVHSVRIVLMDYGALDFVLEARLAAGLELAGGGV